jgi:hypothetical protein
MTDTTLHSFGKELDSFFVLVLLNMAFGSLAMAFGMLYMINTVMGLPTPPGTSLFRVIGGAVAMVCFGLGLSWVVSSTRILKGIKGVRREYRCTGGQVPEETLTCWIVRILNHYRGNRQRIRWMTVICMIGGCAFLALGIANLVEGLTAGEMGLSIFAFIAAGINLVAGCASLIFTRYFRRYAAAWDGRLEQTALTEKALQHALEQG